MTDAKRKQSQDRGQPNSAQAPKDTSQPNSSTGKSANEGEGNRTAARQYNEATREFVEAGKVDAQAESARRAVEGSEREELQRAEDAGRERMKEEDPNVRRGDRGSGRGAA